jgi:hypothetical protein
MTYQILVSSVFGKTLVFDLENTNTVEDVKQHIYERTHFPVKYQKLKYNGRILDDKNQLCMYNIRNKDIIRFNEKFTFK